MATQTYAGLTNLQRTFYERALLKRLLPRLVTFRDGEKASIPEHMGMVAQWRQFASLAVASTALTEGTAPADTALTVNVVSATIKQYGAWVKLSDLLVHQGIDPVWTQVATLLGEQAGRTLHNVLINAATTGLVNGTNVRYANGRVSRVTVAAGDVLNDVEIKKAVRTLAAANVERFPDGYYHALVHPNGSYDIQGATLWQDISKYNGGQAIMSGEIGKIHGVRFIESTDAPIFTGAGAAGIDVYGTFVYGPGWFGIRDLSSQPMPRVDENAGENVVRLMAVPVETASKDDPLGQFGTAGWKCSFVSKILDELRGVRVEHAVSV